MNKPKSLSELQITMNRVITERKTQILEKKALDAQYLSYGNFSDICDKVKDKWRKLMTEEDVPRTIEEVCNLTLATIKTIGEHKPYHLLYYSHQPTQYEHADCIGITIGIALTIGVALMWGTGITAYYIGAPIVVPLGLLAGGFLLAGAAHFVRKSRNARNFRNAKDLSAKAEIVLREGLLRALEEMWEVHQAEN